MKEGRLSLPSFFNLFDVMKYIYVCLISFLLFSCGKKNQDLSELVSSELQFEEMNIEPLLGNPYQMEIIDSTLIIADYVDDNALLLYNLDSLSYQRRLFVGEGPNDILPPLSIDVNIQEKAINVLQRQNGECRKYVLSDLYKTNIASFQKVNLKSADRMVETNVGYIYMGFNEKGVLLHGRGNISDTVVEQFAEFEINDVSSKYKLFQGRISYSKKNDCLLFAPSYVSDILMYTQHDGCWNKKVIFSIGDGKIERRIKEDKDLGLYKDDINHCIDVCKSEDFFYVLYDGSDMGHSEKIECRYIICFDMVGNLNGVYKVNSTIRDICVSDDGVMYALMYSEKDGEPTIGKATLK